MKTIIALVLFLSTSTSWAGIAHINGYAEVQAKPDFVSLQISVKSECYLTAQDVSRANDKMSNQVIDLLKPYILTPEEDEITATGGYVERYTGYDPRNNQPICVRTFRKENRITLKVHDLENFANVFAEIQDQIYALGASDSSPNPNSPTNFVEMATPNPGLKIETIKKLELQALALALADAKAKFLVTKDLAGVIDYQITKYSENQNLSFDPIEKIDRSRDSMPAPILIGSMTLSKNLYVEFSYTNSTQRMSMR